jgi:hypothetical protein
MLQAVHVMGVPVPEVLDLREVAFDLPKYLFLVGAVLKKRDGRAACLWTSLNDAAHANY